MYSVLLFITLMLSVVWSHSQSIDTTKHIETVVITGQYQPQSVKKSVYRVHTISQEKIRLRAATNIQQVLMTEPGFRFNNDLTLGTADIELMGMSGRNVKILVHGAPMLDRSDTRESLNQIDINLVERIEIVEGPMSVIYGSDALAGVINIITKNNQNSHYSIQAKIQEETAGKEYDFFKEKGTHHKNLNLNWSKKDLYINISATANGFGGWNLPDKAALIDEVNAITTKWKPKDQYLGNAKIGYNQEKFNIWYRIMAMQEDIDTRYGINPNNYIAKLQTYRTERFNHQLQGNWKLHPNTNLDVTAGFTDLSRKTTTKLHDYKTNTAQLSTDAGEQDLAEFSNLFLRSTLQYRVLKNLTVQPGFEFNKETGKGARIKGNPEINDYAAFISAEYAPTTYLTLRPGTRFIKNSVYDAPAFMPALNTKIDITDALDVRLSYAKGYRAPALRELYFDFFDASHSIMGNENLRAETSNSWNGTMTWSKTKRPAWDYKASLSGFYNVFKDRIDYAVDQANPTVTTLLNIDRYKTTGLTVDNTFTHQQFKTTLGLSYVGRYNRLSERMNELSEFVWTPEIFADITYYLTKWDVSASLFVKHTGKRPNYQVNSSDVNTATLVHIDRLTWADLMLNKSVFRHLEINLGIKNLFDVTNLNSTANASGGAHGSGTSSISTSYGRSFVFGLTYNWNKN